MAARADFTFSDVFLVPADLNLAMKLQCRSLPFEPAPGLSQRSPVQPMGAVALPAALSTGLAVSASAGRFNPQHIPGSHLESRFAGNCYGALAAQ